MNDNTQDLERVLQDIAFDDAIDPAHKELLEQKLLLHFPTVQLRNSNRWRNLMNSKMVRLAAAAAVLVAVFAGLQFLTGSSSTVWAQVRDQVAAAKAVKSPESRQRNCNERAVLANVKPKRRRASPFSRVRARSSVT